MTELFTRHWRLKVVALLLSMFLWLVFHYNRPAAKPRRERPPAKAVR